MTTETTTQTGTVKWFDALGFGQGLETAALDLAEMREQVFAAAVLGNEAEALAFVEPFDSAGLGCWGAHENSYIK